MKNNSYVCTVFTYVHTVQYYCSSYVCVNYSLYNGAIILYSTYVCAYSTVLLHFICETMQCELYFTMGAPFLSHTGDGGTGAAPFTSATRLVVCVSLIVSIGLSFVLRQNVIF